MALSVNTYSNEEYNQKINYYQSNGFKITSNSRTNTQTNLEKKNYGPIVIHIMLIVSMVSSIVFLSDMVMNCLSFANIFVKLNLLSLVVAVRYLQNIGLMLLIFSVVLALIIIYYYMTQPYVVIVYLNSANYQTEYNTYDYNANGGGYNG